MSTVASLTLKAQHLTKIHVKEDAQTADAFFEFDAEHEGFVGGLVDVFFMNVVKLEEVENTKLPQGAKCGFFARVLKNNPNSPVKIESALQLIKAIGGVITLLHKSNQSITVPVVPLVH